MMDLNNQDQKREWTEPELIEYGSVEEITKNQKLKHPGTIDDFNVVGISETV
jgi:hypothetical protein